MTMRRKNNIRFQQCTGGHFPPQFSKGMIASSILLGALMQTTPAFSQGVWLLPSPIESTAEAELDVDRPGWTLPKRPPFVRDAAGRAKVTGAERPELPLFEHGTVVTTGFSGWILRAPMIRKDQPRPDPESPRFRFLNPNGTVANLLASDDLGFAYNAAEVTRAPYDRILARDVGQVFGIAIDDADYRNLYLTATSAFGLNIVGPDRDRDNLPDRLVIGQDDAQWMAAQWGNDASAGPGSVWKVDGLTGQISLFADIRLDGVANAGPGLGNIAFDARNGQLFVSDLETGMIHRLSMEGRVLDHFDHGTMGRSVDDGQFAFDPARRMDITQSTFDAEDPETWGFAVPERRVWGLTVHGGRLYYAVAEGPSVYSVGLDPETGAFLDDARWELTVDKPAEEISDMVFTGDGAMVLAQRGERIGAFDHEKLTRARRAKVLRYVLEAPEDDLDTPSVWVPQPVPYPVGFLGDNSNALGGVDVGPLYDEVGNWDADYCAATLWTTGEALRNEPRLKTALELGGELRVDGVQAQPVIMNRTGNLPPWESYFADYDQRYDGPRVTGHVGDVEVLGCRGGSGGFGEDYVSFDNPETGGDGEDNGGGGGGWPDCGTYPWLCPPPQPACLETTVVATCDPTSGSYALSAQFSDTYGSGLDRVKISDPSGYIGGLPQDQSLLSGFATTLSGFAPGQRAQLNLCGYRGAEAATGQPYACCNATVTLATPDAACEKEAE